MSMAIECNSVTAVCLKDIGWIEVSKKSFGMDAYEYVCGELTMHSGGHSNISATGCYFTPEGKDKRTIGFPLSSVIAVKY